MNEPVSDNALDAILAVQLTVAWAGEGRCSPPRLGWWDTDLVDESGGGDLLKRLLPQTHAWAALEATREAARRIDEYGRARMADPDRLRTLFFLGFEVDERVGDRLTELKLGGRSPAAALPLRLSLGAELSRDAFVQALGGEPVPFEIVPGGRRILGARPSVPDEMVRRLAAALLPLHERYPLPLYRLED
jgi:hypothetical protein